MRREQTVLLFVFLVMGLVFVFLAPFELPFPITWYNADEGFILYKSYLVSMGKLPYADFDPFWPPLVYYLNALLFKTFGVSIMAAKYGLAAVGLLGAVWMYAVAAKIMPRWIAVLCSTSLVFCGPFVSNVPYSSWYTVPIGLAGLYAVFVSLERESVVPILFAGIAAGLSFSFKQSIGVFTAAAFAVMGLFWRNPVDADQVGTRPLMKALGLALILLMCAGLPIAYVATRTVTNVLFLTLPALIAGALMFWFWRKLNFGGSHPEGVSPLKALLYYETVLSTGFVLAIAPWFVYLAAKLGFFRTLKSVLFIGEAWRLSEMIVAFPDIDIHALLFPALLVTFSGTGCMLWTRRREKRSRLLWGLLFSSHLLIFLYWFFKGIAWRYLLSSNWDTDVFMLVPPAAVAGFIIFAVARLRRGNPSREDLLSLCLFVFCALLLQQSYPFVDLNHFTFGFPPWIILCFFLVYRLALRLGKGNEDSSPGLLPVTLLLVVPLWIFFAGRASGPARLLFGTERHANGWIVKTRDVKPLQVEGSEIIFDATTSRMFSEVVEYLRANTSPTDKVAGLPSLAIFNVLAERQAPMKFVYMWPGYYSSEHVQSVADDIRQKKPKYVIVSNAPSSPGDVFSYKYYAREYPEVASVVDEFYEPEKTIGWFTLMRHVSERPDDIHEQSRESALENSLAGGVTP